MFIIKFLIKIPPSKLLKSHIFILIFFKLISGLRIDCVYVCMHVYMKGICSERIAVSRMTGKNLATHFGR